MERYDMNVKRGETFSQVLLFKDAEGDAMDLSGCQGFCQVRPEPGSPELICSMEVSVTALTGEVRLTIDADTTAELEPGNYAYDFALRDGSEQVRYYLGGVFFVLPSVTVVE